MSKKFFDIIPPKGPEAGPKKLNLKKRTKAPVQGLGPERKPRKVFLKALISFLVFLVLLGISVFFFFSKIKIEIWPEAEILELKAQVRIDSEVKETDLTFWLKNGAIPGKLLEDIKSDSQDFSASGEKLKEEKAKGTMRVYNGYSTSPRTLIPSRFVSAEGKLFWSVKKIVIPGGRYEKGKLIPGEIDVEVIAAEAGEDYNIDPSTFALPALAGSPLYTAIYGRSFSAMTGGFKGKVPQVGEEDLEKAENALTEKLKKESREFLKATLPEGFILLDETITQEVIESSSSQEPLVEAESFEFQLKIKSEGLGFRKSDLENFIKSLIALAVSEDKKLQEESLEINHSLESIDLESGKAVLNLETKAKIYSDVNLTELKKALSGRSLKESKIFLENLPELSKIEIKYWPFWRRKAPEDIEKLEIRMRLDPVEKI